MRTRQCCHRVCRISQARAGPVNVWTDEACVCVGRSRDETLTGYQPSRSLMMQSDDRKRKKHSLNPRSVSDEYSLRERPKEDAAKMKNKVTSQVSGKKKPWSWDQYLEDERAEAAPLQLFTEFQAFPNSRSGFKVGMRLEGIDPLHPSMFCVLSVAEVIGFRLRLRIDGYSECYDFWVNADSPDIKPAGWCESTGHKLHPPKGYKPNEFDWEKYLEACNAQAAPKNLFKSQSSTSSAAMFEVGMKLEAVDRKNPCLVCVATVADIVDNRFLVHFDNWDDTYDYWCDASSPHIHPVGWCQDHGRPLTAPQGHPNPEHFIWEDYMEDTGASAAPSQAFCVRPAHGFQLHMKLEAVDRRNPMLIRVATITDTEDYRVKVHFDGWHEKFDFWVDSDLPDLHPVGWCSRTGHPLEPPLAYAGLSDVKSSVTQGVCPTPGCRGIGHIKGAKYTGHHSAFGCPYSDMNMKKEVVLPDRLGGEKQITFVPVHFVQKTKRLCPDEEEEEEEEDGKVELSHVENRVEMAAYEGGAPRLRGRPAVVKRELKEEPLTPGAKPLSPLGKRGRLPSRLSQSSKFLRIKDEEDDIDVNSVISERNMDSLQQALHQSVFLSAMSAHPSRDLPLCWEQHCKLLPGVAGVQASRVAHWTVEEVADFIHSLPGCEEQAKQFREEQIDGKAFLLLTQRDIVKIMSVKLGPALKIYNSILMFRHAEDDQSAAGDSNT
ncbi:LOW QUALITY PROTEIN: lethal(3)malignant brain tumor-like protein 4 [Megalobrama amblycephala]|uniref:LOW QUALITY PROTEIN: lethal(3)malignant brain tumor-like protein 4 n=1 Tax=Megalobrama amblycephala TaxID=75352 RepID=UPI002014453F|nr:LOW QUALITY PROTEIN: lethal(3)malignant brain tumor-like protein 4 [Megalobrama amblycephala]